MRKTVCVMRDFCPLCLKHGKPGSHPCVPSCVDPEQAECARCYPQALLDLSSPGKTCDLPCRLTCMVCGSAAVFGCEPEFEELQEMLEQHESDLLEARVEVLESGLSFLGESVMRDLERRFQRQLARLGLAWHPRWNRAVHRHCLKKARCDCLLPACAEGCRLHPQVKVLQPRKRPQSAMPEEKPSPPLYSTRPAGTTAPVMGKKATWLSPPTPMATTVARPVATPPVFATPRRVKPAPPKPNPRLQQAAASCGRLDEWATRPESRKPGPLEEKLDTGPFSLYRHARLFDPFKHGYWRVNGRDVYRFPDGRTVPVFSPVNELTEGGELVPG